MKTYHIFGLTNPCFLNIMDKLTDSETTFSRLFLYDIRDVCKELDPFLDKRSLKLIDDVIRPVFADDK